MVPTGWRLEPQVVESRGGHSALNWTALNNANCKLRTAVHIVVYNVNLMHCTIRKAEWCAG